MPTCSTCKIDKAQTEFVKDTGRPSGYRSQCKECRAAYYLRWRDKDPEHSAHVRREASRRYAQRRGSRRFSNYGITLVDFERMEAEQKNLCAICKRPGQVLCIDHDHATKLVRGLLCHDCNRMLGLARDEPAILEAALRYLAGVEQLGSSQRS